MLETLCISSDSVLQGVYLYTYIVQVELGYNCLSTDIYCLKWVYSWIKYTARKRKSYNSVCMIWIAV